jgi:hypothetical protein
MAEERAFAEGTVVEIRQITDNLCSVDRGAMIGFRSWRRMERSSGYLDQLLCVIQVAKRKIKDKEKCSEETEQSRFSKRIDDSRAVMLSRQGHRKLKRMNETEIAR